MQASVYTEAEADKWYDGEEHPSASHLQLPSPSFPPGPHVFYPDATWSTALVPVLMPLNKSPQATPVLPAPGSPKKDIVPPRLPASSVLMLATDKRVAGPHEGAQPKQDAETNTKNKTSSATTCSLSLPSMSTGSPKPKEKNQRRWSNTQKLKHSDFCRHKERLTLAEKLQIIHLYETGQCRLQSELANMFGKSRMTISKILRPENVENTKALAASGVKMGAKRCSRAQYPDLERRLYEVLGMGHRTVTKAEVLLRAQDLCSQMKISDMDMSNKWCAHFINSHDLRVGLEVQPGIL
jgi:hypothetical protein